MKIIDYMVVFLSVCSDISRDTENYMQSARLTFKSQVKFILFLPYIFAI